MIAVDNQRPVGVRGPAEAEAAIRPQTPPSAPPEPRDEDGQDPIGALVESFSRLRSEVGRLASAKLDLVKFRTRNRVVAMVGAAAGGVLVMAIAVSACVCLVYGIAVGLTALFGGHAWLGFMATGVVILGALGLTAFLLEKRTRRRALERMEQKYAAHKAAAQHGNEPYAKDI